MTTAQLPRVCVKPAAREEVERVLYLGESPSEFVEASVIHAAKRRKPQQDFLLRGRASLAQALATGNLRPAGEVLDRLQTRLDQRVAQLRPQPSR
jgi:hypothetical protein